MITLLNKIDEKQAPPPPVTIQSLIEQKFEETSKFESDLETKFQFILFSDPILAKFKMITVKIWDGTYRGIRRVGGTMLTEIVRIEGRQISQNRPHWNCSSAKGNER